MVKRLRALFAKAMSLFNMMFFTIKKTAEAGFIMLQYLFSDTSPASLPSLMPRRTAAGRGCYSVKPARL